MVFSSLIFLFVFLPVTLALYFVLPRKLQNGFLLVASLIFYAWGEPLFVVIMLGSIAGNYVLGLLAERARGHGGASLVAGTAVAANLAILLSFKYAAFIAESGGALVAWIPWPTSYAAAIGLPIGISFFTFQALSYVLDVGRGAAPAQRNPLNVALYIALFPQLIAGPIVRYHDIARQLVARSVTRAGFAEGVRRFIVGLAKKILIADVVAVPADKIFALPAAELTVGLSWLAAGCYTLQIYFDFSGYSDMAIGLGRMLGFRYRENFNYPYVARSLTEFWRRWHISLSTWFRDYLYVPLGGNRRGSARTYLNLVIVFLLCGLWHGAAWNFAVWGLWHGAFLILERRGAARALFPAQRGLGHVYTLLVVMLGWVLFRSASLADAVAFLAAMAGQARGAGVEHYALHYLDGRLLAALACGTLGALPIGPRIAAWVASSSGTALWTTFAWGRVATLVLLLVGAVAALAAGTYSPFIYFRF